VNGGGNGWLPQDWATRPAGKLPPSLPPGLAVAGMGVRLGAWLIDSVIFGLLQIGFWMVVLGLGIVAISPQAEAQLETAPLTMPSVDPYQVDVPALAAAVAIFVCLNVAYAAVSWAVFRGLPGQRLVSLQVGSAADGRNLSLARAVARAILAVGIPMGAFGALVVTAFAMFQAVPWSAIRDPQPGGPADAWSGWLTLALVVAVGWPLLLLVWTAASPWRQGLHDRLAGSLVVGRASASFVPGRPGWPGYRPVYGPVFPAATVLPGGAPPGPAGQAPAPTGLAGDGPTGLPATGGGGQAPDVTPPGGLEPTTRPVAGEGAAEGAPDVIHAATIGRRLAAYLIDSLLVFGVFLIAVSYAVTQSPAASSAGLDDRTYILVGLACGFVQLAYFVVPWVIWQASLGQRLMDIRVTDASTGKSLGWLDAVGRWAALQGPYALASIVPAAVRLFVVIGAAVWASYLLSATMSDSDRRGPHDRFINSRVTIDG